MLSAKSEVSTKPDITRSTKQRADDRDRRRSAAGSPAATTPRKTKSSSRARIGKAISSALVRSLRVWSLVSLKPWAKPPSATSSGLAVGQLLDPFGGDPAGVLDVVGREVGGDRQRLAVAGDQVGAGSPVAQRVDDAADVLDLGHFGAEPVDLAPHGGVAEVELAAVRASGRRGRSPGWGRSRASRAARRVACSLSEARVGEAGRLEVLLDVVADRDREAGRRRRPRRGRASGASR